MTEAGETLCAALRVRRSSIASLRVLSISQRVSGNTAPGRDVQCPVTKVELPGPAVHVGRRDSVGPVW
jgi:hypothetical protein